jgi:hypothetical protein
VRRNYATSRIGLLVSDNLDESINELQALRSTTDATVGGNPQDDLLVDPEAQQGGICRIGKGRNITNRMKIQKRYCSQDYQKQGL